MNCEYPAPVCDPSDHTCKCNEDADCHAGDRCEAELCVPDVCEDHPDCPGHDAVCNVEHDNCFYCDQPGAKQCDESGCCEGNSEFIISVKFNSSFAGCHMDSNCAHPAPICDMADHRCKCLEDANCLDGEKCENGLCVPDICVEDNECVGFDQVCNENHDNCFYCGGDECPENSSGCCEGI